MKTDSTLFESQSIRRIYDEELGIWWFSVVDIVQVLTQQPDYQTVRKYWNKLKERLKKEGSQLMTDCHQLKMVAEDGKQRATDVANALAELSTRQIAESVDATGLPENKKAAKAGGNIAKKARVELEQKTGRKVITQDNYLPQAKKITDSKKIIRDIDDE